MAMTMMAHAHEDRTVLGRVGEWMRSWWERSTALGDLRVLAGRWPDAADLVQRRMAALGIDAAQVDTAEPAVMRDLQRVCSLCDNKRVCAHDLDRAPAGRAWRDYCPNAGTLAALAQVPATASVRR